MSGRTQTTRLLPGRYGPSIAVLALLLLGAVKGCNSESRYEVLSFFFDGVPDPHAPEASDTAVTMRAGRRTAVTYYIHRPFGEGNCAGCHQSEIPVGRADAVPQDICRDCHEDFSRRHALLHGPVALDACNLCHTPHQSTVPGLLLKPPRQLCTDCHLPRDLDRSISEHHDLTTSCINCHDPHGGQDRRFLKTEASGFGVQGSSEGSGFGVQGAESPDLNPAPRSLNPSAEPGILSLAEGGPP